MLIETKRIKSGIFGFDELIEGGIPEGWTVLLVGGPGVGKSIFGMHFIYKGAMNYSDPGLYLSFEETPTEIMRNMSTFGWDIQQLEKENKMKILSLLAIEESDLIQQQFGFTDEEGDVIPLEISRIETQIKEAVKEIKAKRIVIDSIASFATTVEGQFETRSTIRRLVNIIRELGCTAIMTTECPVGSETITRFGIEEFLTQGLVLLQSEENTRMLQILKMRGTKIKEGRYMYEITDDGVIIHPELKLQYTQK